MAAHHGLGVLVAGATGLVGQEILAALLFDKAVEAVHGVGLGLLLARGLRPILPANYRAILAKDVAHTLIRAVRAARPGVVTILSGEMQGDRQPAFRTARP